MTPMPATDREALRGAAYDADDDLRIRRETHLRYSERSDDFHHWLLSLVPRQPGEALLDVGTGPGDFPRLLREQGHTGAVIGCDLSEGMMRTARAAAPALPWVVADAQALPWGDGRFDGLFTRHMLYHVPEIPRAVREMVRVTRPGGWLVAATNAGDSMRSIRAIWEGVEHPQVEQVSDMNERFPLEGAAAFFEPYFEEVVTHTREDALRFPSLEPLLAYVTSARHLYLTPGHSEGAWAEVQAQLVARAAATWEREAHGGILRVPKTSGIVLATGRR